MSVESMAVVLHHSKAKGTAKLVLVGIANHDGDGGAWPSHSTLARYANVDERNVRRAIDALVELGEIRVHTNEGGTKRMADHLRPNMYEVLVTCPPDCDGTRDHRIRTEVDRGAAAPPAVDNSSNAGSDGGRQRPLPGGGSAPSRGAAAPPEPSKNHPLNQGEGSSLTSPAAVDNSQPSPLEDLGGRLPDPMPLTRPDRCRAHQLATGDVPPCGACKEARLAEERRQAAAVAEVRAAAERRERAPACPEHPGGRVGWCSGCAADHKAGDHRDDPAAICHLCAAAERLTSSPPGPVASPVGVGEGAGLRGAQIGTSVPVVVGA